MTEGPERNATALAALLLLMTRRGEADERGLVDELSQDATRTDVVDVLGRLETDGYIAVDGGQVELSDAGWHWCGQELGQHLDDELMEQLDDDEQANARVLYALMRLIGDFLDARDLSLAEFVTTARP